MATAVTPCRRDRGVLPHDMKHHPVVVRIMVVSVCLPVRGANMDFDIPGDDTPAGGNDGITEVSAAVRISPPRVDDGHRLTLFGGQHRSRLA